MAGAYRNSLTPSSVTPPHTCTQGEVVWHRHSCLCSPGIRATRNSRHPDACATIPTSASPIAATPPEDHGFSRSHLERTMGLFLAAPGGDVVEGVGELETKWSCNAAEDPSASWAGVRISLQWRIDTRDRRIGGFGYDPWSGPKAKRRAKACPVKSVHLASLTEKINLRTVAGGLASGLAHNYAVSRKLRLA